MKKIVQLSLVVIAITLFFVSCKPKEYAVKYGTAPSNEELTVAVGDTLSIIIESNISTGFAWDEVYTTEKKIVKFVDKKYEEPKNEKMIGASGKEVFRYVAQKEGTTNLAFEYKKGEEVGQSKIFKVNCKAK